jgi:hypothetical protein
MPRSVTCESVEEYLARGGVIQEIPQGVSGDPWLKFNNVPLDQRIAMQKRKTYATKKRSK